MGPTMKPDLIPPSTAEIRKSNKPLMEKRRRARINKSLNQLKQILIETIKKSTPGHTKWEKADILEMTVQYLRCMQRRGESAKPDSPDLSQFLTGFTECMSQVEKFVSIAEEPAGGRGSLNQTLTRPSLINYLRAYLKSINIPTPSGPPIYPSGTSSSSGSLVSPGFSPQSVTYSGDYCPFGEFNNNSSSSPESDSNSSTGSNNEGVPLDAHMMWSRNIPLALQSAFHQSDQNKPSLSNNVPAYSSSDFAASAPPKYFSNLPPQCGAHPDLLLPMNDALLSSLQNCSGQTAETTIPIGRIKLEQDGSIGVVNNIIHLRQSMDASQIGSFPDTKARGHPVDTIPDTHPVTLARPSPRYAPPLSQNVWRPW